MFFSRRIARRVLSSVPAEGAAVSYESSIAYCKDMVRRYERLHGLLTNLIPNQQTRDAIFAIRAFNLETSIIQDKVADSSFGAVRIAFWRDGLREAVEGKPPSQPVLRALSTLVHGGDNGLRPIPLPLSHLGRVITARSVPFVTGEVATADLQALERYAEDTYGAVLVASLAAARHGETIGRGVTNRNDDDHDMNKNKNKNKNDDNDVDGKGFKSGNGSSNDESRKSAALENHVAMHVGCAEGIAVVLRGVAVQATAMRNVLPAEVSRRHGIDNDKLFAKEADDAIKEAVLEVGTRGMQHLQLAKEKGAELSQNAQVVLTPSVAWSEVYLRALEKADFDPFHETPMREGVVGWRAPANALLKLWKGTL